MNDKKHWMAMTLVCFIIGLLLMVQLHTQEELVKSKPSASSDELTGTFVQVEKAVESLDGEAEDLRQQIKKYEEGADYKRILSDEMDKARMAAGMVELQGPGIIITLNDAPEAVQNSHDRDNDLNNYYIHDFYLRSLVNTLWAAGAEAISINDQRLIGSSEIYCGGPTIKVNKAELTPPFVIKAIGDSKTLHGSMAANEFNAILNNFKREIGLVYEVAPSDKNLKIPALKSVPSYRYAKPAPQKGGDGK